MTIKTILLTCVTVVAGLADTVRLTNGDNMTGRLEKLEDGKLVLKTTYAGAVKIDCAEIANVNDRTSGCKGLELQPRFAKPAAASEDDDDDSGLAASADASQSLARADSVNSAGVNVDAKYLGEQFETFVQFHNVFNIASRDSSVAGRLTANHYFSDKFFVTPWLAFARQHNANKSGAFGKQVGGLVGWSFARTKKTQIWVQSGMLYGDVSGDVFTSKGSSDIGTLTPYRSREPVSVTGLVWQNKSLKFIRFNARFYYLKPIRVDGHHQLLTDSSIKIPITKSLFFTVTGYETPDVRRKPVFSFKDLKLATGLGFEF